MSLATRCPACATTFKVVRDQLRISDGWVRCGRCSHVFDATLDLQETAPTDAPPPAAGSEDVPVGADAQHAAAGRTVPSDPEAVPEAPPPRQPETETEPEPEQEQEQEQEPTIADTALLSRLGLVADEPWPAPAADAPAPPASPYPAFPSIDLSLASPPATTAQGLQPALVATDENEHDERDETEDIQFQKALRRARAKSAKIAKAKARGEERAAARDSASMMLAASEPDPAAAAAQPPHAAPRGSLAAIARHHLTRRRALVGAAALALLLLVVQVLRHERDWIAAHQPGLRPVLAALCDMTGCELAALRQIGDIAIDGAAFAREKGSEGYRLSFTLRNDATVPLAMPAIELSLLDTQERAVVRRVLTPTEFGAPAVLPARAERAASLPLVLSSAEAGALPPIAGYRVIAFYP